MNRDRDLPPFYRAFTILMYADDVPGKLPDEQVEAKEREAKEIILDIVRALGQIELPENWELDVVD